MHRAQELARLSLHHVTRGEREAWLALFAENAVLHDPYGPSPFDPDGKGFHGRQAIAGFWDAVIAGNSITGRIRESYPAGDSCANLITTLTRRSGQPPLEVSSVTVYQASDLGEIVRFTAYWSLG